MNLFHRTGALGALLLSAVLLAPAAQAAPECSAFTTPIHHRINPATQANLLTRWQDEADNAGATYGFTDNRGTPFNAARSAGTDLAPVRRLYKGSARDFVWMWEPDAIAAAVANGYTNQATDFYASKVAAPCLDPVYRYRKGSQHRHVMTLADRDALEAAGWTFDAVSFYAVANQADPRFSIAVIPDTQNEAQAPRSNGTRNLGDLRFRQRAQWLASQRHHINLEFVTHIGDVVNWGERDEHQYQVASDGIRPLEDAGIPYSLAVGNHDTRAVCAGGSACPGESASVNVRLTPLFNEYFNGRFDAQAGQYETGKVDNSYSLFEAGGLKWMVLTLELWPRQGAINWAKGVVAAHPDHNVIVVTHSYLDANGNIWTSNGGYGSTSPRHLFDTFIRVYPNIRMVFSGHTGQAASRLDTGVNGNRIASFLQAFHSNTNPVRIVEIDTAEGSLATYVHAPGTGTDYPQYDTVVTGMDFVD